MNGTILYIETLGSSSSLKQQQWMFAGYTREQNNKTARKRRCRRRRRQEQTSWAPMMGSEKQRFTLPVDAGAAGGNSFQPTVNETTRRRHLRRGLAD